MITVVNQANQHIYRRELGQAFELRRRIFKDKLNWDVSVIGNYEIDQFDFSDAIYLLFIDGAVKGVWRVLPTLGAYMLKDAFPQMLEGEAAPRNARIWEVSRLAVQENLKLDGGLNSVGRITAELLCGLAELAIESGVGEILSVQDVRITRLQSRLGCRPYRLSRQHLVGDVMCELGRFRIDEKLLHTLRRNAGVSGPVLAPHDSFSITSAA